MKKIVWALIVLLIVYAGMMTIDYLKTMHNFKKPIFAVCLHGYDDGGSGTYAGIGYTIDIKGNFMPEDELSGVTEASFYILGSKVGFQPSVIKKLRYI
ncbi:MAG: hypothetical protein GX767_04490 [Firmicutes bacterium]|nr:hypothetical protein [Bacillota bacterium]